jgi:DNA mismatch repair ATPase MutS
MLFHFQENPDVDGYFDYRLKSGPATARNAIKLLKKIGFPEEIVANAMSYAEWEVLANISRP